MSDDFENETPQFDDPPESEEVPEEEYEEDEPSTDVEEPSTESEGEEEKANPEESPKQKEDEALAPEIQEKIGKAISAERKKIRREFEEKLAQQTQVSETQQRARQEQPANTIWDPEVGEYVSLDSPIGQTVLRNYKIAEKRREVSAHAEANELRTAIEEGYSRFDHEKYDQARETFIKLGSDVMAEALKGADDAAAVLNYLGAKPSEIKRISQLPPAKQMREIHRVDELLSPRKKMVTNAKPPMKPVNSNKNYAVTPENQGYQAREDYWRKVNNPR